MYQTEINGAVEALDQIPADIVQRFTERRAAISARSVLAWSEHCTECAAPACFQTCDLYEARYPDAQCRRFVNGMVRIDHPESISGYLLKIAFKRWGKLWAPSSTRLFPMDEANRLERRDRVIGAVWRNVPYHRLPVSEDRRTRLMFNRYTRKKRFSAEPNTEGKLPNLFLFECHNPNDHVVNVTLSIHAGDDMSGRHYSRLIELPTGFTRTEIPVSDIAAQIDLRQASNISIAPNEIRDNLTLVFGTTEFVFDTEYAAAAPSADAPTAKKASKVKCIVWDLDNTLWDGVLIEGGVEGLTLKPGIADILKTLDERGILHSVASKNDHDAAMAALKHFGLADYFLCPQISWDPKGRAVRRIADILNIGADTLLFIDDQPFEREEVAVSVPEAQIADAAEYADLPDREGCEGSTTADAARRREMYREQIARRETEATYAEDDYIQFLADCAIEVDISTIGAKNIERVHELAQRTNQLNFSGNRYKREDLDAIAADPAKDTYVLKCRDKFGDYGTVGFGIVETEEARLIDLAFSCRVQNKRVEHAFLAFLLRKYLGDSVDGFRVDYRKTERNAPQARVFEDLQFAEEGESDGVTTMIFPKGSAIPDDGIIAFSGANIES